MAKPGIETVTPQLRFPQFGGANGWQVKPLGSICEVQNNRRRPITSNDRVPGPYPYYGASGVVDFVSDYIFDERLLLVGEDGAKWGRFESTAFIAEGKYWVNNHAHVLKAIEVKDSLLENYLTMLDIAPFVTGAAPPKLTLAKLKSIPIPVPPTSIEQQKIASCLTSLDEVIAAQGRKVEALKAHKRGLMQQLFPREGETRPRLRFPEFRNAPDWQQKALGEIANVKASGDLDSSLFSENRSGDFLHPVYSNAVERNGLYGYYSVPQYPGESVTITARGTLGIAFFRDHEFMGIGRLLVVSDLMDVHPRFLTECWNHLAVISNEVTSIPQLTAVTARATNLPIPSIEEQSRIADCLSSLDTQITAESSQLAALKTHKQGLMQQLFPSLEGAK